MVASASPPRLRAPATGALRGCLLGLLIAAAGGCALQPVEPAHAPVPREHGQRASHHGEVPGWPLQTMATLDGQRVGVPAGGGVLWFEAAALRAAWAAAGRVEAATPGARPQYRVIDDASANAFALRIGDVELIGIHAGMVRLLGADEAAWAALIGHELAHLNLRHADQQGARRRGTDGIVAVAGVILTIFGFPLTPILAEVASDAAEKGYSRADERAADEAGIASMLRAGYEAEGAVRFFEKLAGTGQSGRFAFFDTHPDHADRVAAARALLRP